MRNKEKFKGRLFFFPLFSMIIFHKREYNELKNFNDVQGAVSKWVFLIDFKKVIIILAEEFVGDVNVMGIFATFPHVICTSNSQLKRYYQYMKVAIMIYFENRNYSNTLTQAEKGQRIQAWPLGGQKCIKRLNQVGQGVISYEDKLLKLPIKKHSK